MTALRTPGSTTEGRKPFTFGSLFSGIGGMDLGLERAGMVCKWQVEIDPYCLKILAKHWPEVPKHGDITQLTGSELGPVDLIAGGFPCQDISSAGTGGGITASRSGLWKDFARMVGVVRPRFVLVENSPALRGRGLAVVLQNLAALGFDAEWNCIPAGAIGAHHQRDRIYILAYASGRGARLISERPRTARQGEINPLWPYQDADSDRGGRNGRSGAERQANGRSESSNSGKTSDSYRNGCYLRTGTEAENGRGEISPRREHSGGDAANSHGTGPSFGEGFSGNDGQECAAAERSAGDAADLDGEPLVRSAIARGERHAWTLEPGVVRMVHGVPHRVERIRGLGNAVVPQMAEWLGRRILEAA